MKAANRVRLALAACAGLIVGCSDNSRDAQSIRQAAKLTLYEGLPHQMYEEAVLLAEKKAKPTIESHGFPFYREPLVLKGDDEQELVKLLGDTRTYTPYLGEKKCGGFHPDYAVAWSVAGEEYIDLICFGCGEIRAYGPGKEAEFDIARDARERMKAILTAYVKNRPPPSAGP